MAQLPESHASRFQSESALAREHIKVRVVKLVLGEGRIEIGGGGSMGNAGHSLFLRTTSMDRAGLPTVSEA